jgi:hypothetical protein
MSKQYWIMDPSKTSIFISFDRRGEAEDWLQEKEAFVKSKDSILHGAHIVERESPKSKIEQLCEVLGPAIEAARNRQSIPVNLHQLTFQANDKALLEAGKLLDSESF